jgi:alpha-glucosidase
MKLRNCVLWGAVLSLLLPFAATAQDEQRLVSPRKQVEYRIFIAPQQDSSIVRIAYQVFYYQMPVVQTSFLALDIWSQEPMLGESTGLIGSRTEKHDTYNSLTASFMQNGSLGRLLTIEARAYDDGLAFRWIIPNSTPLRELLIADEATEFALPDHVDPPSTLPLIIQEPGQAWLEITEVPVPRFPVMHLENYQDNILLTRLAKSKLPHDMVYVGTTPLTGPWRVVALGPTRGALATAANNILTDLSK